MGKLSSIFVSETSNTSILPLIWSDSISNLFLMEFIFKCANTSLSRLLMRNDFRNFLRSIALSASSDSSESHTSKFLLKLSKLCQLKTLDNSYTKISLSNFVLFWFKCNFPLFKWFLLILVECLNCFGENICGGNSFQYIHGGYFGYLKLPKRSSTKRRFSRIFQSSSFSLSGSSGKCIKRFFLRSV